MMSRHCIGWCMYGSIEDHISNPTTEDYSHDPSAYEFEEELPVHILQITKCNQMNHQKFEKRTSTAAYSR